VSGGLFSRISAVFGSFGQNLRNFPKFPKICPKTRKMAKNSENGGMPVDFLTPPFRPEKLAAKAKPNFQKVR